MRVDFVRAAPSPARDALVTNRRMRLSHVDHLFWWLFELFREKGTPARSPAERISAGDHQLKRRLLERDLLLHALLAQGQRHRSSRAFALRPDRSGFAENAASPMKVESRGDVRRLPDC